MALLKIARMGHPVLRGRAAEIDDPKAPWVRRLVEDMVETMEDAGGTGIAAPQVHEPHRIVVFRVPGERLTEMRRCRAGPDRAGQSGGRDDRCGARPRLGGMPVGSRVARSGAAAS